MAQYFVDLGTFFWFKKYHSIQNGQGARSSTKHNTHVYAVLRIGNTHTQKERGTDRGIHGGGAGVRRGGRAPAAGTGGEQQLRGLRQVDQEVLVSAGPAAHVCDRAARRRVARDLRQGRARMPQATGRRPQTTIHAPTHNNTTDHNAHRAPIRNIIKSELAKLCSTRSTSSTSSKNNTNNNKKEETTV